MKCLCCNASFEPTEEEDRMMRELHDGCSNIPFCSKECFCLAYGDRMSAKVGRARLFYHEGDKTLPQYGTHPHITIRPMTDKERVWAEHYRGRETFSYGASVLVLPSAVFYGRYKSPVDWVQ